MSFSDKAKSIIGSVAPLIGTALGGPFGGLAGAMLSKALGTPPGDTAAIEAAATSADPEILLKIKQADNDFKIQTEQLGITRDKLVFDDIANARAREVAVKDTTPRNLAYMILVFTGACIAATLMGYTKVESALAGTLIGYLIAESRSALTYYFGSSSGSQSKTDAMTAELSKK